VEDADKRLLDRFVRLCQIASPTGSERAVADNVLAELRALGVEVSEDGSAEAASAAAGNLIARIPGSGEGWLSFFSHLDTVPHEGEVVVVEENGVYRSRGETILGADHQAPVTVLIALADRHAQPPPRKWRKAAGSSRFSGRSDNEGGWEWLGRSQVPT